MSTAIAFLSGKGGSGKTTLALSMADLLCRCEVKTLLIDCDLSTNGATYFYEARLPGHTQEKSSIPRSFSDVLSLLDLPGTVSPLSIKENYDFIPFTSEISDQPIDRNLLRRDKLSITLSNLLSWARKNYEVILFDCQAGYTELLPALLPLMDVDLFVLEPDSISASAMRSLHLKAGNYFGHAKLYQVFNKATPEEFESYSKIVGTFFINIGTLLFDWKIRQAFSRSRIPDLENTSAKFGADLCDICKTVFKSMIIQDKLNAFSANMLYLHAKKERKRVENELNNVTKSSIRSNAGTLTSVLTIFFAYMGVILGYVVSDFGSISDAIYSLKANSFGILLVSLILISFCVIGLFFFAGILRDIREKLHSYKQSLKELDSIIQKFENERSKKEE